jgi:hypothetical protein
MVTVRQLEECLWPRGPARDVWMIVDSARDRRIFGLLLECFYSTHSSLFATPLPPQLEPVSPYLVPLDHDDKKTRKLLSNAWGDNWGVFLRCDTSQERLRRHLRSFVSVRDPAGRRLLFRYYDPRILRTYLPTCTRGELEYVFGPIDSFWAESRNPDHLLEFGFERGKLVQRTISLEEGAPRPDASAGFDEAARIASDKPFAMLTIRHAQMEAFSQAGSRHYEDAMATHLKERFRQAEFTRQPDTLRDFVCQGIQAAASYGVADHFDVRRFLEFRAEYGPSFDTMPWAAKILHDRTLSGCGKMDEIDAYTVFSLRKRKK